MRFNQSISQQTINYEKAKAWKLTPELELYTLACTSVLHDKFYTTNDHKRICNLISRVNVDFVKNLAIYIREKMYLRTVPIVILGQLAKLGKLDAETVYRVIQRADEITELLSYYKQINGDKLKPLSKAIQKGIKIIFERGKFDEYQLAKYNRKTNIRLRDALFLTHPKPSDDKQADLFKRLANEQLKIPYTWETQLSERGNTREVWEELIDSGKLPYMATLRNLRNMLRAKVSKKHIRKVADFLSDPMQVRNSKQLPFRFFSAYREIQKFPSFRINILCKALEKAARISIDNIPLFTVDTKIVIACDVSGSMEINISPRSKVQFYDIGLILGMLLQSKCDTCITGIFGDDWIVERLPKDNVLANTIHLHKIEGEAGYSTNGYKVIEWLLDNDLEVDRIMIFTDCQLWNSNVEDKLSGKTINSLWKEYRTKYPEAKLYLFDLAGYGNTPLNIYNNQNVFTIAGWSEKIFEALYNIEQGKNIIEVIKGAESVF